MDFIRYIATALLFACLIIVHPLRAQVISTVAGPGNKIYNSNDSSYEILNAIANPNGIAVDDSGYVYIGEYYDAGELLGSVFKFKPNDNLNTPGGAITHGSSANILTRHNHLSYPHGIALDKWGNIYVAEYNNHIVRKITPSGNIIAIAGTGVAGYSGDGKAATAARLSLLNGLALDDRGNVFIADEINNAIRKVNAEGIISTYAGSGEESGYSGDGGPANRAELNRPYGVAADRNGNVYFSDTYNNVIRKVNRDGVISTVAGNGKEGYGGDGGAANAAMLNKPAGIALDAFGNLYIADDNNDVVRKVTAKGIISTVAGNGRRGYKGDGRQAASAELSGPRDVAIDHKFNLYIADFGNHVIRKVILPIPVELPPPVSISSTAVMPAIAEGNRPVATYVGAKKLPVIRAAPVSIPPLNTVPLKIDLPPRGRSRHPRIFRVPVYKPPAEPLSPLAAAPQSALRSRPGREPALAERRVPVFLPPLVSIGELEVIAALPQRIHPDKLPLPDTKEVPVFLPPPVSIGALEVIAALPQRIHPVRLPLPEIKEVPVFLPPPVSIGSLEVIAALPQRIHPIKLPSPETKEVPVFLPPPVSVAALEVIAALPQRIHPEKPEMLVAKKVPAMIPVAVVMLSLPVIQLHAARLAPEMLPLLAPIAPPISIPPLQPIEEDHVNISVTSDNILTIKTEGTLYQSLIITNMAGEQLIAQPIKAKQTEVDLKDLPPGRYTIDLKRGNENKVLRFVKDN